MESNYRKEWDKEWLGGMLLEAHYKARKGKRRTFDEQKFESCLLENIYLLREDIMNRTYKPSRSEAFIIRDPVPREIFAAPYRDRVVHHLLFLLSYEFIDKRLIYGSCSCRKKKGTLFGILQMEKHMWCATRRGREKAYIFKGDIQGYFMSLPRVEVYRTVKQWLEQQLKDEPKLLGLTSYLWKEILLDDPIKGVKKRGKASDWDILPPEKSLFNQAEGVGIVIGNLTSQLVSNIYLDKFDRYMKYDLGYKRYGRYVDDFYVVVTASELEKLKADRDKMTDALMALGLKIHPRKCTLRDVQQGTKFLGAIVYPDRLLPGSRLMKNFLRAAIKYTNGKTDVQSLISYIGHMKHFKHKKAIASIFRKVGWDYNF